MGRGERFRTASMALAVYALMAGLVTGDWRWGLTGASALALTLIADGRFLRWLASQRGWFFVARALPFRALYYALNVLSVGLALLPIPWRRKRRASATLPEVWVQEPRDSPVV